MTTLRQHPAYLQMADRLDAIGQRYRVFMLLRGLILFSALAVIILVVASVAAGWLGAGLATRFVAAISIAALAYGLVIWLIKPLVFRPKSLAVARMIESRVGDVHNALTNGVLLAEADDLQTNPWLDPVIREIAGTASSKPLHEAVRFSDLRKPAIRSWGIALPLLIIGLLLPGGISHGLMQMAKPSQFVPVAGAVELLDVKPGNATVIKGRSLEISALAKGPDEFAGTVFFEDGQQPHPMTATPAEDGAKQFAFVRDHVDQSTRYRLEVGSTQSPWYTVTAIRQVALAGVSLTITPPAYTKAPKQTLQIAPAEIAKQAIVAPRGSKVEIAFDIDVPVTSGMLQLGDASPIAATATMDGKRFAGESLLKEQTPVSLLLTDGGGQIIARTPEQPLVIQCENDLAPVIEMKWPQFDTSIAPAKELRIEADLRDDYGVSGARLLWTASQDDPMAVAAEKSFADRPTSANFVAVLPLKPDIAQHGKSIWIQIEATDNRDLTSLSADLGPQTTSGRKIEIRFRDPQQITRETSQKLDKLRQQLEAMLKTQRDLHEQTLSLQNADPAVVARVHLGQTDLRKTMLNVTQTFEFTNEDRLVQKTLQVLVGGAAQEAIDYAKLIIGERDPKEYDKLGNELRTRQRRVIQTLENLLAMLRAQAEATTQPTQKRGSDLVSPADEYKKLDEALKQFIKEEQRILDQTSGLAKKSVDNFDDKDRKLLEDLKMAQEKLDAFMQQKVSDFSNVAEQDMANASMLKELLEVQSEVTMAKDALKDKAVEMAIAAEENGLELAKEATTNIEKWLMDKPDRQKWTQEDQLQRTEAAMPELPTELEDMVGQLMENQEDLFDEMEDANANWHDSPDKGAGWDAADGPIDSMSARGVTGNQLPNNNEMGGRSGEGRSGKSQGEMVGDSAVGKGGRNTPTRLDPTAFQQGQIKDSSQDPTGGATGGGKLSGQGGAGLEGPTAPQMKQQMERLKQRQAELRNTAERLNLQYKMGSYDNFKMLEAVAIMRRVESDMKANRYQNALRRKDVLLDAMDNSRTMIGGEISVQHDTTPTGNRKLQQEINDAMKGSLPPAWESALKEYYKKLGQE